jgi:hypothetical protein
MFNKFTALILAFALVAGAPARASDEYKFTLSSVNPTATTNDAVTQPLIPGGTYAVWCSNTVTTNVTHIRASVDGTAATTDNDPVGEKVVWEVTLVGGEKRISVLASGGTSTCRVALRKGKRL